jgi:hypothetical protein
MIQVSSFSVLLCSSSLQASGLQVAKHLPQHVQEFSNHNGSIVEHFNSLLLIQVVDGSVVKRLQFVMIPEVVGDI